MNLIRMQLEQAMEVVTIYAESITVNNNTFNTSLDTHARRGYQAMC